MLLGENKEAFSLIGVLALLLVVLGIIIVNIFGQQMRMLK